MNEQPDQGRVKGMEARLFLFLVICLFPLLSVALVGGFGFCVWMYQLLACPEGVLKLGAGRLVELDLSSAGCTLCGECASRCEAGLFDGARPAFPWIATIGEACLALAGIHCRSCQDACEPAAIRFRPAPGGVALAELDSQRCNGCGACLAPCPSQAIQLRALSTKESPRHA